MTNFHPCSLVAACNGLVKHERCTLILLVDSLEFLGDSPTQPRIHTSLKKICGTFRQTRRSNIFDFSNDRTLDETPTSKTTVYKLSTVKYLLHIAYCPPCLCRRQPSVAHCNQQACEDQRSIVGTTEATAAVTR